MKSNKKKGNLWRFSINKKLKDKQKVQPINKPIKDVIQKESTKNNLDSNKINTFYGYLMPTESGSPKKCFFNKEGDLVIKKDFLNIASTGELSSVRRVINEQIDGELMLKICQIIYHLEISYLREIYEILSIDFKHCRRLMIFLSEKNFIETDISSELYFAREKMQIASFENIHWYRLNLNQKIQNNSNETLGTFLEHSIIEGTLYQKIQARKRFYELKAQSTEYKDEEEAQKKQEKALRKVKKNPINIIKTELETGKYDGKTANYERLKNMYVETTYRRFEEPIWLPKKQIISIMYVLKKEKYVVTDLDDREVFVNPFSNNEGRV